MPRQYRNYTDENIIEYSKEVKSISGLLKKLNLRPTGGNYSNMKKNLQRLDIDTSHWTGQGWNKGQQLKDWSQYTRASNVKPHLIKSRSHKCEVCYTQEWMSQEVPLEVHHIDGDRTNNDYSNLQLLCCNCHAQTDNWRNKKNR